MQQLRQHFLTNKQVGKAVSAQLCVGVATFGTTVNGVFYGGKPMGGENNWICIFEADCGCMGTLRKIAGHQKGRVLRHSPLFLIAVSARTGQKNSAQLMTTHTNRLTTHFLPQA